MGYLRTAAYLLDELPKLKVEPETLRLLRERLTKRKVQIAANRTGGA